MSKAFARHVKAKNLRGLEAYVLGEEFRVAFNGLAPDRRLTAARLLTDAYTRLQPKLPKAGSVKANWRDPVFLARFQRLCAQDKSDAEIAAICKITAGAARRARHRYAAPDQTISFAMAA